jgi:hypothetical protein
MVASRTVEKALVGPMRVICTNTVIEPEGLVLIIDHLPRFIAPFFGPLRHRLSKPQFAHLWSLLLALLACPRRANLSALASRLPDHGHRTSHGRFLAQADWDAAAMLDDHVTDLLRRMKPKPGEVIYLLIDDTRIAKRGRQMHGVTKMWDHKQQR